MTSPVQASDKQEPLDLQKKLHSIQQSTLAAQPSTDISQYIREIR